MADYRERKISEINDRFYEEFRETRYFVSSGIGSRGWFDRTFRSDVVGDEAILVCLDKFFPWGTGIPRSYEGIRVRKRFTGQIKPFNS